MTARDRIARRPQRTEKRPQQPVCVDLLRTHHSLEVTTRVSDAVIRSPPPR